MIVVTGAVGGGDMLHMIFPPPPIKKNDRHNRDKQTGFNSDLEMK